MTPGTLVYLQQDLWNFSIVTAQALGIQKLLQLWILRKRGIGIFQKLLQNLLLQQRTLRFFRNAKIRKMEMPRRPNGERPQR